MSSFLNRLKNLKTGSINSSNNEGDAGSICSFDEEGFLCPICHRKFADTTQLEHHYVHAHSEPPSASAYEDTNGHRKSTEDSSQETSIWKQQFVVSEESRMQLSSELMLQRQKIGDLEEEVESLQKQLRSAQTKVIGQSQEIGNLKATKDVYDAQIAMFTDELLSTQGELKEKQNQVDTLCNDLIPRPTNDDVDVLKRELITVQQRMNDMSLEKEQQIEQLRTEISQEIKRLDQVEESRDQNLSVYDQLIHNTTSQMQHDVDQVKQLISVTRERKKRIIVVVNGMRTSLNEKHVEIAQLKETNTQLVVDLEQQIHSHVQLTNEVENERKQNQSQRIQIETLTNDIQELERNLNDLKEEKNQLVLTKMDGDQDDERQNLVRQLTQEKDQYEQQTKDLRKQLKQLNEDKENLQQQLTQEKNRIQEEQIRFTNQIDTLQQQQREEFSSTKEKLLNELSSTREDFNSTKTKLEDDLREARATEEDQRHEIERYENLLQENQSHFTTQIDELQQSIEQEKASSKQMKLELDTSEKVKEDYEKQIRNNEQTIETFQTTISHLHTQLDRKDHSIRRLSTGFRQSINLTQKTHQHIQTSQTNLLDMIEQFQQESQIVRSQTFEDIRQEFTDYLTVVQRVISDDKSKLEKQIADDKNKLHFEQKHAEKQLENIQNEHTQLINEYNEQKKQLETQLGELHENLLKVSESLSETTQTASIQRENLGKQISSLEQELTNTRSDLESRTKKYEMQLSALKENLATIRSELKVTQEKLVDHEKIKSDKADLEHRLLATQDERQACIERSLTSENRNEKLLLENGELAKKNSDLESALQEIAREYQGLQIHTNRVSERRWLNDHDVHECMKCNQTFSITQRKHHCRSCGNVFCDACSSKTAIIAASSKKPQRICDPCYDELTS